VRARKLTRRLRRAVRAVPTSIRFRLARLPSLAAKERVYDERFYRDVEPVHEQMYDRLADVLYELVRPASVVDVGCGTGRLLERLAARGAEVVGIEGSRRAIAISPVRERIVRWNLERGVPAVGRFDLCLCVEVAEHLPARRAKRLVRGLAGLSDLVVFTAATPGQGGILHLNEREPDYWIGLFAECALERFIVLEDRVKAAIADIEQPFWMHTNLMTFATPARAGSIETVSRPT
jgi:SAM-dependent methyltransferase